MTVTVCTINPPGHDWENGLTCRWCQATRTVTEAILSQLSSRRGGDLASAQTLLDAYRAEVLAEAKVETVAWLVKKAAEGTPVEDLASKVDRGAVRAFLGTAHYRDALDAHRAQVLAEDGQAYDGELAMLHGLIATLTVVAEHGDLTQVRKLLEEHQADTAAAREAAHLGADKSTRQSALLAVIRSYGDGGRWKSGIARQALAALGYYVAKGTASGDLAQLATEGHLVRHDEKGVTYYRLARHGGDRRG